MHGVIHIVGLKPASALSVNVCLQVSIYTTCCNREDDPEPVKRLKREMAVALSEEDYVSAARIRDHPFMKLAVQIIQEKLAGRESEAEALQAELQKVVRAQQ